MQVVPPGKIFRATIAGAAAPDAVCDAFWRMQLDIVGLVGLAGQKAWHICVGETAPRISGKYFPSQLRTHKPGPEPATTGRGGGDCGLFVKKIVEKRGLMLLLLATAEKEVEQAFGRTHLASATGPMMTAAKSMRRSLRRKDN